MTYEELKVEADKLGYNLIKKNEYVKFLPCTCGYNRRGLAYSISDDNNGDFYYCKNCSKKGPVGKNPTDAKRKWNEMIEAEIQLAGGKDEKEINDNYI